HPASASLVNEIGSVDHMLYDNRLVASGAFRFIHRLIHSLENYFSVLVRRRYSSATDTDGQWNFFVLVKKTSPLYEFAHPFSNNRDPFLIRSWKNYDEFLTSITRQKVRSPQNPFNQLGELFQTSISRPMPIEIVD